MLEKTYSKKEVAKLLSINPMTVYRWGVSGKIKAIKTPTGRLRYPESEIKRILGEANKRGNRVAIYVRVSSHKQKDNGNLERQKERLLNYARDKNYEVVEVYTEVAS